jgi:acetyltransferase EpsM
VFRFLGFVDDGTASLAALARHDAELLGKVDDAARYDADVVIAIGDCFERRAMAERVAAHGMEFATLVEPSAYIGPNVELGVGTAVLARAVISTDVVIGMHGIVLALAGVYHDVCVGDYVTICPAAQVSGGAVIGSGTWIGLNAAVNQLVRVGSGAVLGNSSAAVRDLPDGITAFGVPARAIPLEPRRW